MPPSFVSSRWVFVLTAAGLILPIVICVLVAAAALLNALGDAPGGVALARVALAGGILWTVELILLVLALGIRAFSSPEDSK
jgi:hypothetical protein